MRLFQLILIYCKKVLSNFYSPKWNYETFLAYYKEGIMLFLLVQIRYPNHYKKFFNFSFSPSIRKTENNIIFNDEQIKKSKFYNNKKLFKIDDIDIDKILISKEEAYGKKAHLDTSFHIMMVMSLDHYV